MKRLVIHLFILKFVDVLCNILNLYFRLPQKINNRWTIFNVLSNATDLYY